MENILIENHRLPNEYWMPKMHNDPIRLDSQQRFLFFGANPVFQANKTYKNKCMFYKDICSFWVVKNKKPVIDAKN